MLIKQSFYDEFQGETLMKKRTIFLLLGIAMSLFAVGFIWFAIHHPTHGFTWPLAVTDAIYAVYTLINISCYVIWGVLRRKEKKG